MAEVRTIQNSFGTGEISPLIGGRTDQARYFNSCHILENFVPLVQGGVRRRGGMAYAGAAKAVAYLFPFIFSESDSYVLEFTNNCIRFWTYDANGDPFQIVDGGGWPIEVVTTYTLAELPAVLAKQSGDVVFLVHKDHPQASLTRVSATSWILSDIVFDPPATYEADTDLATTLYALGTIGAAVFLGSGLDDANSGGTFTGTTGGTPPVYTLEVDANGIPDTFKWKKNSGSWTSGVSMSGVHTLSDGVTVLFTNSTGHLIGDQWTITVQTVNGVTFVAGGSVFLTADVGRHIKGPNAGSAVITSLSSATTVIGDILGGTFPGVGTPIASGAWWLKDSPVTKNTTDKAGPKGTTIQFQTDDDAWRTADVGKYVQILGGTVHLNLWQTAKRMQGVCVAYLSNWNDALHTGSDYAYGGAWTLESETWTAARGYPSRITLGEQRVFYAGSAEEPDHIRATEIADYYGFPKGILDSDALDYVLASEEVNIMSWLHYWKGLACGTLGSEFTITGNSGGPLVPAGAPGGTLMTPQTTYGSEPIPPQKVEDALLFVERSGRKVREFIYDSRMDSYRSFDLTAFADHLTWTYPFTRSAYQKTPYQLVWYIRSDGSLCPLAYSRENEMTGWARATTGASGVVVSSCCVPNPVKKRDDLWLSLTRVIGGSTVQTVEVLSWDSHLDCAKKYAGAETATLTGLGHLNGQSCQIRGKGADGIWRLYPAQTLAGGSTPTPLSPKVVEAEVGIGYTATLTTNRLEIQGKGTLQGQVVGISTVTLRCLDTPCLQIGGVRYKAQNQQGIAAGFNGAYPTSVFVIPTTTAIAPPLDDGDVEVPKNGYDRYGRVTIVQDLPIETTVMMLTALVDVGEA